MMQSSLARTLRVLRAERGWPLREAAARIGVTKETLSDLERGLRQPHDTTLAKIARGYGIDVEELLGKEGARSTGQLEDEEEGLLIDACEVFTNILERDDGHSYLMRDLERLHEEAVSKPRAIDVKQMLLDLADEVATTLSIHMDPPHYVMAVPKGAGARNVTPGEHKRMRALSRAVLEARRGAVARARLLAAIADEKERQSAPSEAQERSFRESLERDLQEVAERARKEVR